MASDPRIVGDPPVPPGWSYDPSAWSQRLPLVALAVIGAAVATHLTLFQLGIIADVWEPFFGDGSRRILTSGVSRLLPIPDAALGVLAYLVDAVAGAVGGRGRWRTMPWITIVFGIAVGPLGAVSILLVIIQPVVYGAWCTLCLTSAAISVIMIGPAMDELLASLQYLGRVGRQGGSRWRAFWGMPATTQPTRAAAVQLSADRGTGR
ncbi:MAG: vitamin K epoxide reductase family protein [Gemmatimonadaceae bacterium]